VRQNSSFQFAFPNSYYRPSSAFKVSSYLIVAGRIARTFVCPIFGVFFWSRITAIVAVPETSVYENGYLFTQEHKVGSSFDLITAERVALS
jgi:hypothetical protein